MTILIGQQAREGHGGGFNERQDRASVATVEVDEDGYDDFGRKKIKALADKKAKEVRRYHLLDGPNALQNIAFFLSFCPRLAVIRIISVFVRMFSNVSDCDTAPNVGGVVSGPVLVIRWKSAPVRAAEYKCLRVVIVLPAGLLLPMYARAGRGP